MSKPRLGRTRRTSSSVMRAHGIARFADQVKVGVLQAREEQHAARTHGAAQVLHHATPIGRWRCRLLRCSRTRRPLDRCPPVARISGLLQVTRQQAPDSGSRIGLESVDLLVAGAPATATRRPVGRTAASCRPPALASATVAPRRGSPAGSPPCRPRRRRARTGRRDGWSDRSRLRACGGRPVDAAGVGRQEREHGPFVLRRRVVAVERGHVLGGERSGPPKVEQPRPSDAREAPCGCRLAAGARIIAARQHFHRQEGGIGRPLQDGTAAMHRLQVVDDVVAEDLARHDDRHAGRIGGDRFAGHLARGAPDRHTALGRELGFAREQSPSVASAADPSWRGARPSERLVHDATQRLEDRVARRHRSCPA